MVFFNKWGWLISYNSEFRLSLLFGVCANLRPYFNINIPYIISISYGLGHFLTCRTLTILTFVLVLSRKESPLLLSLFNITLIDFNLLNLFSKEIVHVTDLGDRHTYNYKLIDYEFRKYKFVNKRRFLRDIVSVKWVITSNQKITSLGYRLPYLETTLNPVNFEELKHEDIEKYIDMVEDIALGKDLF